MVNHSSRHLDAVFAALSDPTRRSILERLSREGATVTEVASPFAMSLPAVSRHLRVLESAGLIQRRVEGRVHRLGLLPGPLREAASWLDEHRRFWESRLDALARYVEDTVKEEDHRWKRRRAKPAPRSASSGRSWLPRRESSRPVRRPRH